jgi:crotonobetainyl-CoA:carnitine CoA-transferase CaiB-like acyl-CoA transferase
MSSGVLSGVKIVELGDGHALAVAAMLLAEAGADVVKVESEHSQSQRLDASFAVWNRSKRSVVLDLDDPAGQEALVRLIAHADVLITDLIPSMQVARGMDFIALGARFPTLLHTSIGGWPAGHPLENALVDDTTVLAESGLLDEQRGYRDGPIYLRFPLGSWGAAYLAAIGTLAKLIQRGRGKGGGGAVRTSLVQGALVPTAMLWRRAEHATPVFTESMGKTMRSPQFECADGVWLHLKAPPDDAPLMRAALDAMGPERVAELNRGHPSDHTCRNWGANAHIFKTRPSAEWLADLWSCDIPVQADVPMGQVYFDQQAAANGYVVAIDDPHFGPTLQPGPPVAIGPAMAPRGPAPILGSSSSSLWDDEAFPAAESTATPRELPLAGVRVADFGAYLAGPLATMLLADLGAEVVKIEGPAGDVMRRVPGAFIGCQRGKQSLALDMKAAGAAEVTARLARWADVVHHNIRLPAARRLGLDYPALSAINPDLIFSHVSSYGPVGPRKDWPGYDQLFQAQTGWEYEGAGIGNQPMWHRFGMMDHQAAMASVLGTLLALYHRDRTGRGQAVAASLLGASLLTVSETVVGPDGKLTPFQRLYSAQTGVGPGRRLYRAVDGWVAVVADAPEAFGRLLERAGVCTADQLEAEFAAMTSPAIAEMVAAAGGVAATAHEHWRDNFFDDPANQVAGLVKAYQHPVWGRLEMVGSFLRIDGSDAIGNRPPPEIGEHSLSVLHELGFDKAEAAALVAQRVVASLLVAAPT